MKPNLRKALCWPSYTAPEPMPAPDYPDHTEGYDVNVYRAERGELAHAITAGWSECNRHGTGAYKDSRERTASQRGVPLYRTRVDALRTLRVALSKKFAAILAEIDAAIEKEEA